MSETLRDRNASMPDCTLSGARTKKAVETAVHVDRGRSTITWKTLRGRNQRSHPSPIAPAMVLSILSLIVAALAVTVAPLVS